MPGKDKIEEKMMMDIMVKEFMEQIICFMQQCMEMDMKF